ncbi:hypothetical protein [Tessaracoccus palaemonis]|uniref:Holliday junction nuclease RuvC n=1 Tax=Tessaracoccus palaemonis TaxID=2829499 RepID=A0ABX8SJX2_9ACTN|nr:hypothetical protein [Tessaracoccus palaemonis]QXT62730.1 hypothetical protein KDB89_13505 [Tessaracoccus palaemonis]
MRIVGLDLSLTATGVAIIDDGQVNVATIRSAGRKGDSLLQRSDRLGWLAREIGGRAHSADLVVVEQPAYAAVTGHHHDRSGLWWLVIDYLSYDNSIPVAEVAPGTLKKFVSGRGNAGKDEMLLAAAHRFARLATLSTNDEADALGLALMGAEQLGVGLVDLPAKHREALKAVRWPEAVLA